VNGCFYYAVLPWILKREPLGTTQLLSKLLRVGNEENPLKIVPGYRIRAASFNSYAAPGRFCKNAICAFSFVHSSRAVQ